ncbi:DUF2207 domain-containing protein [Protaetiibacter intestinalis]|uniref:DUF2207 domain-containing protein n=1 Tax=Protaetiibacter intestinalis TaxID=2419774 RepID=UPI00130073EB|nr:DUF2207 domain-containing protein [Protaetiibacter intestinalis]
MRRPHPRPRIRSRLGIAALLGILATVLLPTATASAAVCDFDDFTIASFDAQYTLGRDADGHATLHVVESIVARFPDFDQNHGLERAIPTGYARLDLGLSILSVSDGDGRPRAYSTRTEDYGDESFLVLQIGDADRYLHGDQEFVIEYTMRDVVRSFADTGADEFYWDVNGDGWAQPFTKVTATLHLDEELQAALTGEAACYVGGYGDTTPCALERTSAGFTTSASDLGPYQTVTWAIGFHPGTFAAPPLPTDSWIVRIVPWVLLGVAACAAAVVVWLRLRVFRDAPGRGIVVPQYEGFPGLGVMEAATLLGMDSRGLPAQFVQLVVTRAARLVDRGDYLGRQDRYRLELVDPGGLDHDDAIAVASIFGGTKEGSGVELDRTDRALGDRLAGLTAKVRTSVSSQYRARRRSGWATAVRWVLFANGLAALIVWAWAVRMDAAEPLTVWTLIAVLLGGLVMFGFAGAPERLTRKGSLAREHLEGIRDYLQLAEADRIRVLQSPEGAPRTRIDTSDGEAVVRLDERLLPYAIIWGVEERWQQELGSRYATTPTELATTVTSTNFAAFATGYAVAGFATTPPVSSSSSSWSGSGGSSFSGGSGGGGFSGGGGGGGGGGGW